MSKIKYGFDFDEFMDQISPDSKYSQIIVRFNFQKYPLFKIVKLVENVGGEIYSLKIIKEVNPNEKIVSSYKRGFTDD